MRNVISAMLTVALTVSTLFGQQPQNQPTPPNVGAAGQGRGNGRGGGRGLPAMLLTSTAWQDGAEIPAKHVGGPSGVSPDLAWSNAPAGTVEFVLIMTDPEPALPLGSLHGNILHWLVAK